MINETLNNTIAPSGIPSYDQAVLVLHSPPIFIWVIIAWLVPLFLYLVVGCLVKGRSSSGQTTTKPMIMYRNFWHAVWVWTFIQAIFLLLLIFPIWLRFFN